VREREREMETLRVDREKKQAAHLVVGLGLHFPEQQVTIQDLLERHDGGEREREREREREI
jgi:hypothetical protein